MAAEVPARIQRRIDRIADNRIAVAIQPGGVLTQHIGVSMAIRIPHPAALATHHRQRKGGVEQHGAGVAARHDGGGLHMRGKAGGIAGDVVFPLLRQCRVQAAVGKRLAHPVYPCSQCTSFSRPPPAGGGRLPRRSWLGAQSCHTVRGVTPAV